MVDGVRGDPLLDTPEEQKRLREELKDHQARATFLRSSRGSGLGPRRGAGVLKRGRGGAGRGRGRGGRGGGAAARFVRPVMTTHSLSSGRVTPVAKLGTSSVTARGPDLSGSTTRRAVTTGGSDLGPQSPHPHDEESSLMTMKITDLETLEYFEGGVVTEEQDGIVVMFDPDDRIETKITGTLREHYQKWVDIGASDFAKSVIRNGYIPQLGKMPTFYSEQNNKSYRDNSTFANEAVLKLLSVGIVAEVPKSFLRCINPLTVAQNTTKPRLCIDLSRCFNVQCDAKHFKIVSTVEALQQIDQGDFMFSFDLKSAYLQVPMNSNFWPFLGFAIQIENNGVVSERYFCYKVLPFGLNDAARVLTKLLKSPLAHWHAQGISVFLHLDDGFSFSGTKEQTLANCELIRNDLLALGLLISEEKCSWGAKLVLDWTGFTWNSQLFRLFVTERKIVKAERLVAELANAQGQVTVRHVARLVGLLVSFYLAMGPISRFQSRGLMTLVATTVKKSGWNAHVLLDSESKIELDFWMKNMRELNGALMRSGGVVNTLDTRDLFSDAGELLVGSTEFVNGQEREDLRLQESLDSSDVGQSSTFRELRALEIALSVRGQSLQGQSVRWNCDSQAAVTILRVGSMKSNCHAVAKRIWQLVRQFDLTFECVWQPRESAAIMICDTLSKSFDSSDYKLSPQDFQKLLQKFGPFSCDVFASPFSHLFKPFFSRYLCKDAEAVDAFSVNWANLQNGFFHPPVTMVTRVLKKAQLERATGVLVTPEWPTSAFWPLLVRMEHSGQLLKLEKFRPKLITAQWVKSEVFRNKPNFDFVAWKFRF